MDRIIGCWEIDKNDIKSVEIYGNVSIEFKQNGELIYTVHTNEKKEIILMMFEIKGHLLITNQLSAPNKQETEFKLMSEKILELFFNGEKSTYIKKPCS